MPRFIEIDGSGVAACCCARLLQMGGSAISVHAEIRSRGPVLMLSEQTQKLLLDVFGNTTLLFPGSIPIRRRFVLWGKDSGIAVLPHSGLVTSESTLLGELWRAVPRTPAQTGIPEWQIISGQAPPASKSHRFGTRIATQSTVRFRSDAPQDACWMESLESGWLFLLPCGSGVGSLISVGSEPTELVEKSRLVADQIEALEESQGTFAAYPRITAPLCADAWIACGTSALGFDPIGGEGAGNAVREAILACAVIAGAEKGLKVSELLALYSSRLLSGFIRHLDACLAFYRSASRSRWWEIEISHLEEGVAWSHQQLSSVKQQKYRLTGFELQRVS